MTIIDLSKKKKEKDSQQVENTKDNAELDLVAVTEANKKKKEKLAKERAQANKQVLREYNIKHNRD
jgi:hypothetical protein